MTTYNTGNPIGSTDARDLYDNAQNLDTVVNSTATTFTDRFGIVRPTLASAIDPSGFAQTALSAKTAAETARDAAFVNANVYDTTTAGLAATTNGQQFQVVSGDKITRYKNNAGSAVAVATYPAEGVIGKIALQLGRAIDQSITSGSVGDTTPNSQNLGAGTYAPVNLCPAAAILKSVSFRVSWAGTFEIHAYKKLTDTSWQCTAIWAGSTTASNGSLVTLTAGGGVIPSNFALGVGDFIAFKSGTCFIKYASGNGWVNLNNVGAVGAVVTRTLNTNGYAISIAFDYEGVGDNLQAQVTALGARTTTLEAQDVSSLQNAATASASLLVPGVATPTGWKNIGSKIAGLPVIAKTGAIKPLLRMVFKTHGPSRFDCATCTR